MKNTRRAVVTHTVTYTATVDLPGYPEETNANVLVLLGGSAGNTGTLSMGDLLAGSTANNGTISKGAWSVSSASNIDPYIIRPASTVLALGTRVASVKPVSGNEGALAKLFVVTSSGTTGASATEPTWALTDGNTTADNGVTYRTIPKFPTLTTFVALTAYAVGIILRPAATSMKEFLVTTATTTGTTLPTWTNFDSVGATSALPVAGAVVCISGCVTYAFNTAYALGAVVKPSSASAEEYLVTTAGKSDVTALTTTVGASVTRGTAIFKRII